MIRRAAFVALVLMGCGSRTGLREPRLDASVDAADIPETIDAPEAIDVPDVVDVVDVFDAPDVVDAFDAPDVVDVVDVVDVPDVPDVRDVPDVADVCVPVRDSCAPFEFCGNGLDDDCNGRSDDTCTCTPGAVQPCFDGPPGRRNIGACQDGTQRCLAAGRWTECEGGISPQPDVCNGQDNACTGCPAETGCPILCPGPNDPRVPDGHPFGEYPLRGGLFFGGRATSWRWTIRGGPCDELVAMSSFTLTSPTQRDAVFRPSLSGDYTVTLTVVDADGRTLSCTFVVHIAGPGLRVELCWDRSSDVDVDLYLHRPGSRASWWPSVGAAQPTQDACSWANCEAVIRGDTGGMPTPRANWGYLNSPLSECQDGPHGMEWRALGFCGNPRLDIDNNLSKAMGTPENINIDRPRDGETFRVMAHNFTGTLTHPLVNIYCDGRLYGTYGAAPDLVGGFAATGGFARGAMWRAVDVTTRVNAAGETRCELNEVHPPGMTSGYDVTIDNVRF
ncbi:MAG: hypothetical protein JWM10_2707 [Myxococcaceae bacterium]|nr:hypothetical protein [Myxococcaceae bacterium]